MKMCTCPKSILLFEEHTEVLSSNFFIKYSKDTLVALKKLPEGRHFWALKLCASEASAESKNGVWGRSSMEKFRKSTLRKIFAPKKRWKWGSGGEAPGKKNRVLKNVICGLVWNFLSKASEPSASRKKNVECELHIQLANSNLLWISIPNLR